jgi:ribosomal protein L29
MTLPQIKDARKLSAEELGKEIVSAKKQLFQLRMAISTSDFKQTHLVKHTKHRIAQLLTVERERQIAVAKIQGRETKKCNQVVEIQPIDSKIDVNILYAFDLINRGLKPEVRVINKGEGLSLINMIIQLYVPSWKGENIPDYYEDFRFGNIVGFLGSLDTVNNLKQYAEVKFIEASKPAGIAESYTFEILNHEENNIRTFLSPAALINASGVHSYEKGDRAIIAIIDDGIDIFHESFYTVDPIKNNVKTRVLAVWDQTDINYSIDNPSNIVSPGVCRGGREYTQEDIQVSLDSRMTTSLSTRPRGLTNGSGGHGTMVSSIAAGNQGTYFPGGVAPEAKIVLVKIDPFIFISSHIKAINYIQYLAEREKSPVVINVSQGINAGAHDGISRLENAYESFLDDKNTNFERSVVKSAGNERTNRLHASIDIINKGDLSWDSSNQKRNEDRIQLWFSSVNRFMFCVEHENLVANIVEKTEWVDMETIHKPFSFSSGNECVINYSKHKSDDNNSDSCVEIIIYKGTSASIMTGHWKLKMKRKAGTRSEGKIHAWIEIGTRAIQFKNHVHEEITLTLPGTAKHIITVGSAVLDTDNGRFDPASTSSLGPTRDSRDGKTKKPCVAAPGEKVCAAYSGHNENDIGYAEGTSVSAPQIAGAIALVLSARSKLSPSQKLTAAEIQDEIRQATIESGDWSNGLGHGVLDTEKLFNALTTVN